MNDEIFVTKSTLPPMEEYIEMISPLWSSHWLTNMGSLHKQLEDSLKKYLDVPQLSLMVNGHMSLELLIQALNLPKGGEVITSPFTFVSTTHAIIRNGLVPVFCDIKDSNYTIDETKIEALITRKTVAILPVHVYGQICDVNKIAQIAEKHHLRVIYDAAHTFGETYQGRGIGNFGDASVFSFHATKVFHTIEGGAVAFHEPYLYQALYDLKNFGIRSEEEVLEVGANAKMNEFSAAMGLCNLKYIDSTIEKRREKVCLYRKMLQGIDGVYVLDEQKDVRSNYAYFPIRICAEQYGKTRDALYQILKQYGIHTRKYFYPLTCDHACYHGMYHSVELSVARKIASEILVLPLYSELSDEDITRIANIVVNERKNGAKH